MEATNGFSDILVLDFSRYLPGGYATQPLADWGARVIKVEDTDQGDFCRHDPPTRFAISYYSTALCRNKQSISLNLKDPESLATCLELAQKADLILESFRPGVTKKLGIDYATISATNPSVIYASITAYGQDDSRSKKAMHDLNMQAQTGYLSLTDDEAFPLPLVDFASAMVTGQALLAALFNRERTGEGAYIDISMFDSFVWWQSMIDSRWAFNGGIHKRSDLEYPAVGYNLYRTADDKQLAFAMLESKFWIPFTEEVGLSELKDDCRKRQWQAPDAFRKMEKLVASKTLQEWKDWLEEREYSISPVLSKDEAIIDLTCKKPNLVSWVNFDDVGCVLQTNIPHNISNLPTKIEDFKEAHRLGQDTKDILIDLGYDDPSIKLMAERGAIKLDTPVNKKQRDNNVIAPE